MLQKLTVKGNLIEPASPSKVKATKEKSILRTEAMLVITDLKMMHDTVHLAFYLT